MGILIFLVMHILQSLSVRHLVLAHNALFLINFNKFRTYRIYIFKYMFIFNVVSIGYLCKYIPTQHRLKLVQNSKNQLSKGLKSKMLPKQAQTQRIIILVLL